MLFVPDEGTDYAADEDDQEKETHDAEATDGETDGTTSWGVVEWYNVETTLDRVSGSTDE